MSKQKFNIILSKIEKLNTTHRDGLFVLTFLQQQNPPQKGLSKDN